ncbi:limonene-1,2-epoxide hydrolase [Mycolicibacterium sp. CH28]|uniref:limonene-1,2-epoxide hydrolase family protein n=1 Tax=Mycolicibacterium sp. CH28 TaxID=2512237 RepID=UPI0010819D11|nr:limonene-1,2-epoxide hydrolase family protein [Mycolicibacterium sp. CH28]TGD83827.1 limonene-1,2-epoxide hydrolase [Mycolicibacterium sp. CH28]
MSLLTPIRPANATEALVLEFFDCMGPTVADFKANYEKRLSEDAVWETVGLPARVGKRACIDYLDTLAARGMQYCTIEILGLASAADLVLSERVDTMYRPDGTVLMPCRIMGTIQVKDGAIVRYTDYMDLSAIRVEYDRADQASR